ncbi:hypothetical protein [Halosegnis marinus]|uniref:Integral membrane protein n=1 Tax=Halosegnis marinus TaxID=3034023 RepID=A0ABD5ZP23_9EURY|nr:hypothetical protein [Halosegnis sp. DT85]
MYAFPFALVLGGLGVGLSYVLLGATCYFTGYRTDRPRLKSFGETLLTRSPACIVGVAVAYVLLTTGVGVLALLALGVAAVGALLPPAWALIVALDDAKEGDDGN